MKPLSTAALTALSTVKVFGQTATIEGQLERALYVEVNKALEALGGVWSRKLKAHVFAGKTEDELRDALEDVLSCGGFVDKKQELGQFFTPAKIAALMVKLANIKPGHSVLEPSAGHGAIVMAVNDLPGQHLITAIELDPENARELAKHETGSVKAHQYDFLALKPVSELLFDRIVMNPPFRRNADIEHVLHAWKFLKPGGRLVSVMANGVTFRKDSKAAEFRQFVKKHGVRSAGIELLSQTIDGATFLALPSGSFAPSGTQVNTVVVVLDKPAEK